MRVTLRQWMLALSAALLIHAALVAAVLSRPQDQGASAAGQGGIEIGLGPAGAAPGAAGAEAAALPEAETAATAEASAEPPPEEPVAAAPDPETPQAQEPAGTAPATPAETAGETPTVETAETTTLPPQAVETPLPLEPAEAVAVQDLVAAPPSAPPPAKPRRAAAAQTATAPPPPRQKPRPPRPTRAERPRDPPPQDAAAEPVQAAEEETAGQSTASPEPGKAQTAALTDSPPGEKGRAGTSGRSGNGSGDDSSGGGRPGAVRDYGAELTAWLSRHKKYPRRARLRGQQGRALLFVELDRDGTLLDYRLEETSGHKALDREVMAMVKRAEPLPKPPEDLRGDRLTYRIPVDFFFSEDR